MVGFNKKIYGIRLGLMLEVCAGGPPEKADVVPETLKSWSGYLNGAKKLEENLGETEQMECILCRWSFSDLWYPYLWMLGGQIEMMMAIQPRKILVSSI
jgi:hypothetical protein